MEKYCISCIVIGLNSERTLHACLQSIKEQKGLYIKEIIYVDGGSRDKSIDVAKKINNIKVVELNLRQPTPGKGRNAGWKIATGKWVHFFDGDTIVNKNWISKAVEYIDGETAAIFGQRKEMRPRENWFHFIADLEWTKPNINARFFGGDVLVRRSVLEEIGGYDEALIAGEDPELSARIRNKGWRIVGINSIMCHHDININNFTGYFKRSFRSGYGYAEVGIKMLKASEKAWFLKTAKISIKITLVLFLFVFTFFYRSLINGMLILGVSFFPLIKTPFFQKKFDIKFREAIIYALHCSLVIWPQFFGILKYYYEKIDKFITKNRK